MVSGSFKNIRPRKIFSSVKVFTHSQISRLSSRKFQNKLDDIDYTQNIPTKFYKKIRKILSKSKYRKILLLAILGGSIGYFCYAYGPSRELILLSSSRIKSKLLNCFSKAPDPDTVVEINSNPTPIPKTTNKILKNFIALTIFILIVEIFKDAKVEPTPATPEHQIEDIPFILIYGLISGYLQVTFAGILLYYNII